MIDILFRIYLIFILLIPFRIKDNFYLATLISIIIFILLKYYNLKNKKSILIKSKIYKYIFFIINTYSTYLLIISVIMPYTLLFNISKAIPLLMINEMVIYYQERNDEIEVIKKFFIKISLISLILSLIFYLFGFSRIVLDFNSKVIKNNEVMLRFNENRLEWVFGHKSEFAIFCFLILLLVFYYNREIKNKILILILTTIAIILSNTKTAIFIYITLMILFIFHYLTERVNNIYLKLNLIIVNLVICIIILINKISFLSSYFFIFIEDRNLSTLGSRTIIWDSALETIKVNLLGIYQNFDKFISNKMYSYNTYNNSHNSLLQEFVESGVIGGVLFLLLLLLILILIYKRNKKCFFVYIGIILAAQMDLAFYGINKYILFFIIPLFLLDHIKKGRKNLMDSK